MWTALVIILPPVINRFPCVDYIAEPVFIEALISESSVKTFNKSVLSRLAWLDNPHFHAMLKGHWSSARQVNSGPCSVLIVVG